MSAIQNTAAAWPAMPPEPINSKYEKCRHITEEIYKRINITFQIKRLETGSQSEVSDHSDQIDSNELSNETDLFAYEQSDSIPSSVSERDAARCERDRAPERDVTRSKVINLNNNEINKCLVPIYKPPRKRLRKKIKKRQSKTPAKSDSEGSSDEAPLSRIVVESPKSNRLEIRPVVPEAEDSIESADNVMGVPKISILTTTTVAEGKVTTVHEIKREPKPKSLPERTQPSRTTNLKTSIEQLKPDIPERAAETHEVKIEPVPVIEKPSSELKQCSMCSMTCRGDRGLRRHMSLSHILIPESATRPKTRKSVEEKTV